VRYAVIYEKGRTGYGAYVPDLPGCVAVGKTLPRVQRLIREAIGLHIEAMRDDGDPIPKPTSRSEYVTINGSGKKRVRRQSRLARMRA
jgi:predicted RNase H-like HicB family nuclease